MFSLIYVVILTELVNFVYKIWGVKNLSRFPCRAFQRSSWKKSWCFSNLFLLPATGSRSPSFSGHLQRTGFALVIPLIIINQSSLLLQAWLHVPVNNLQPAHQVLFCTLTSLYLIRGYHKATGLLPVPHKEGVSIYL